jgi:hypothetical protein
MRQPRRNKSLNLRFFNLGLLALIMSLGFCYLVNVSNLTVQGFALQDLKSQMASLASEKASNEEIVNSIQSYYSLNERTKNLNMVAIGEVEYLTVNHQVVAKK